MFVSVKMWEENLHSQVATENQTDMVTCPRHTKEIFNNWKCEWNVSLQGPIS